jgi:hypothetical protein
MQTGAKDSGRTQGETGQAAPGSADLAETIVRLVQLRRNALTYHLARMFYRRLERSARGGEAPWRAIESMSALRTLIGGRFEKLKQRWNDAGLPLREHRGDRSACAEVDADGWRRFTLWLNSQGYEVRRGSEDNRAGELGVLFYVRRI